MKTLIIVAITVFALLPSASCKSNSSPDNSNADPKPPADAAVTPVGADKIVGEWELVKVIPDKNDNHVIDADEEKEAITNMPDYLKLNANGTCLYTIAKMEGRYDIVVQKDGRKKLVMYDKAGTETTSGRYILSVTDKELVFNRIMGGSDFEVFKRL